MKCIKYNLPDGKKIVVAKRDNYGTYFIWIMHNYKIWQETWLDFRKNMYLQDLKGGEKYERIR